MLYAFSELDGSMVALTSINDGLVAVHALNNRHAIPMDRTCFGTLKDTKPSSLMTGLLPHYAGQYRKMERKYLPRREDGERVQLNG